jgi:hypothetical protein
MRAFRALIVVLLAAQVVPVAMAPASAQVSDTVPCPAGIPDARFTDIDQSNIHKHDIVDCITGQWFADGTLETTVTLTVEFIP